MSINEAIVKETRVLKNGFEECFQKLYRALTKVSLPKEVSMKEIYARLFIVYACIKVTNYVRLIQSTKVNRCSSFRSKSISCSSVSIAGHGNTGKGIQVQAAMFFLLIHQDPTCDPTNSCYTIRGRAIKKEKRKPTLLGNFEDVI